MIIDSIDNNYSSLKGGTELFCLGDSDLGFSILDFWRWSASNILSNATRGALAEFIVGRAVGMEMKSVREEWDAYDLVTPNNIKIEVKSSAYLQAWSQKKYSNISFGIRSASEWDAAKNMRVDKKTRLADVYVFCLLKHKDRATVNPLNLEQWEFYVLSTEEVNTYFKEAKTVGLTRLRKVARALRFEEVKEEVLASSRWSK